MRTFLLALILAACCAGPVSAASLDEVTPYFAGQYFTWKEYFAGRRLLKESGPLFSGGVLLGVATDSSLTFKFKEELFGGKVGYDGETQAPQSVPVKTDVIYFGTNQQFDLGYRVGSGRLQLEPFGGVGYRWWLRALQDATASTGKVAGYTEWWQSWSARMGARGRYRASSGVSVFAEGGAKYPFYTTNSVDFAGSGRSTFEPGGQWSGFAETGVTYRHLKLAFYYEGFRFSQSPDKLVGGKHYFQPDSSSDLLGMRIGWAFR